MKKHLFVVATFVAMILTACGPKEKSLDQLSKPMQSFLAENEKHNMNATAPFTQYMGMTIQGQEIEFTFLVDEEQMSYTFAELKEMGEYEKMVNAERQEFLDFAVRIAHSDEIQALQEDPYRFVFTFQGQLSNENLVADVTTEDILFTYNKMREEIYCPEDRDADSFFDELADSERFVLNLEIETRAGNWDEVRRLIDEIKQSDAQLTYSQAQRVSHVEELLDQVEIAR